MIVKREWAQEKMPSQETPENSPYDCSGFTKGTRSWLISYLAESIDVAALQNIMTRDSALYKE
jgi:hypothetical protein